MWSDYQLYNYFNHKLSEQIKDIGAKKVRKDIIILTRLKAFDSYVPLINTHWVTTYQKVHRGINRLSLLFGQQLTMIGRLIKNRFFWLVFWPTDNFGLNTKVIGVVHNILSVNQLSNKAYVLK